MAQNLNFNTSDSWCYEDKNSNCIKYGRLYTWAVAKKSCPAGWRLPSDDEWKKIANAYGGYYDWSTSKYTGNSNESYKVLIQGGNSGFSALLGGCHSDDGFSGLGNHGYYWSSSERNSSPALLYHFMSSFKSLARDDKDGMESWGFACRCLQD